MSAATDFAALKRLPPAEAIAYAQGRTLAAETFSAYDLWRDEHGRAFTISRLARADLLEALQDSLKKSVAGDMTRRDWIRSAEQLLKNAGWWGVKEVTDPRTGEALTTRFNHARLQLIFDTNVRQAQAAGQWQRMLRNRRTHPYARYVTMDDGRVRPLHRSWHNVTLPLDDPWWATHRPPNGYRCRCRVVGVTQREYDAGEVLDRPGAETERNAPVVRSPMVKQAPDDGVMEWRNPATGAVERIPAGIDPGFDYNAGTTGRSKAFDEMVQAKLARLSPEVAQAARKAGLSPEFEALPNQRAVDYVGRVAASPKDKQPLLVLGDVAPAAIEQAQALGLDLAGRQLALEHDGVRHTLKEHGPAREVLRGQIPVTAADMGRFMELFNRAELRLGNPPVARDGSKVLEGEVTVEGVVYYLVARVRRKHIVPFTMYKRSVVRQ